MSKTQYKICVSGAAKGESAKLADALAQAVGTQIVKQGHIVLTGATTGLPYAAAHSAKAADPDGISSIGISPAASMLAHVKTYRFPTDVYDVILYTGFGYTGRDVLLVRSSDAVVMVGGRIGTLHELAIALEEKKPIGVLLGSGGMTEEVEHVLNAAKRSRSNVIFDHDPAQLVNKLAKMVDAKYKKFD
jgi:uncharacterized protein (TIGR00725 family)